MYVSVDAVLVCWRQEDSCFFPLHLTRERVNERRTLTSDFMATTAVVYCVSALCVCVCVRQACHGRQVTTGASFVEALCLPWTGSLCEES